MPNQLFEFTAKVARGEGSDMPGELQGAYVTIYAAAPDHQAAVRGGVAALRERHFVVEDIEGDARQIPADRWDEYVAQVWPEFADHFPSGQQLMSVILDGGVFLGPFAGFSESGRPGV